MYRDGKVSKTGTRTLSGLGGRTFTDRAIGVASEESTDPTSCSVGLQSENRRALWRVTGRAESVV
jgi:hypothetical protein